MQQRFEALLIFGQLNLSSHQTVSQSDHRVKRWWERSATPLALRQRLSIAVGQGSLRYDKNCDRNGDHNQRYHNY
jgi:hypothetical protein